MPQVIAPNPGKDDQYFWDGVAEDKLLLRRCTSCKHLQQPPTPMCPKCHGLEWETQEASGKAKVYSWLLSKHPTEPDDNPRLVVLVELEEGVRLVSNLQGIDVDDVKLDMPVEVFFDELDGVKLPQFRPVGK